MESYRKRGGFWTEVPSIPGCVTQGDTWEELLQNIYEATDACLSVETEDIVLNQEDQILEI